MKRALRIGLAGLLVGALSGVVFAQNRPLGDPTFSILRIVTGYITTLTSTSSSPASSGVIRLARTDTECWRNAADNGNLCVGLDGSNNLEFNSVDVATAATVAPTIIAFQSASFPTAAGTYYIRPWHYSAAAAGAAEVRMRVPFACKISKLYLWAYSAHAGAGSTYAFTVRKNGVDQSLTVTLAVGTTSAADTSNSFTAAAGDEISVKVVVTGTVTGALGDTNITLMLTQV